MIDLINKFFIVRNIKIYLVFLMLYSLLGYVTLHENDFGRITNLILFMLSITSFIRLKNLRNISKESDRKRLLTLFIITIILVNLTFISNFI